MNTLFFQLTQLNLKDMTMTGFRLFHLLHDTLSQSDKQIRGHDTQLWEVALKSKCTDVSREAIDYLNNCYMIGECERAQLLLLSMSKYWSCRLV